MRSRPVSFIALLGLVTIACGDSPQKPAATASYCKLDADCKSADQPLCDSARGTCVVLPAGHEIGYRDGGAQSVTLTELRAFDRAMQPVDLAFHPTRTDELWVIGYGDDSVQVGSGISSDASTWKRFRDPAASHFMHKPPAFAMGEKETFGTCGDNDNKQGGGDGSANLFMGPALFSTDVNVFAKRATALGSHLDMLHHSPFCRGIAHAGDNVYWVFNGYDNSIDKVDFHSDHGPGNDDHSDGEIFQYVAGQVKGAEDGTPSHVTYDAETSYLYIADTGNARIVRLDTRAGSKKKALPRTLEPLKGGGVIAGVDVEVVVTEGTLEKPSGIELRDGRIYVTDSATSTFHAFDRDGKQLRKLATDLPSGSLAGFTFGADGKVYFADKVAARVLRIDPR